MRVFQVLILTCLVGYSVAFRFHGRQKAHRSTSCTSSLSLSMSGMKDMSTAAVAIGLFATPVHASTMIRSTPTTFGAPYEPPAVTIESATKAQASASAPAGTKKTVAPVQAPKPAPKFRTSQELALYNFNQKLIALKDREGDLSKSFPVAKKYVDNLNSKLAKTESQIKSAQTRLKDKKAESNKEYKLQKQKELSDLQGYENVLRGDLRSATSEASRVEDSLKRTKVEIEDLKKAVASKEIEVKEKLKQLAKEDKAKVDSEKKKQKNEAIKDLKKQEEKAKSVAKKAADNSVKASEAVKKAAAEVSKAKTELQKELDAEKAAGAKVDALLNEIRTIKDNSADAAKAIAASREKVNAAETNYKKQLSVEEKEKAEDKEAKSVLSGISSKLKQ